MRTIKTIAPDNRTLYHFTIIKYLYYEFINR